MCPRKYVGVENWGIRQVICPRTNGTQNSLQFVMGILAPLFVDETGHAIYIISPSNVLFGYK